MEGYMLASTCCRVPQCFQATDADGTFCQYHEQWNCPECLRHGRYAEARRQYDRYGIYCGRMCDACYEASGYASYIPEEPIDEEW